MRALGLGLALLLPAWLGARAARADDNSAAVEALFRDGKQLAGAGNFAEACPKFLASYNLEQRVGTLLNLADCYEKNGQIASAWARFVEARTLAARYNQTERVDFATQHATALEPRRSMLTIVVPHADPGLVVKRDGTVVDPAVLGVAVPVDGGTHTIEATAPGKTPRSDSVSVQPEGDSQTVTLPPLADAPAQPVAVSVLPEASPRERPNAMKPRAVVAVAIAGAGAIAVGVGTYLGVTALSKNSDSSPYCDVGGVKDNCWGQGVSLRKEAVSDATLSTVLLSVGTAAIAGGVILWFTTPSSKDSVTVGFDGRTLRLGATF